MSAASQQFTDLVHEAVAQLTERRHGHSGPVAVDPDEILAVCGRLAAERCQTDRWRWRGHGAARQAASYLAHLQPPDGWRREEHRIGEDAPLVWCSDDCVLVDVLSTGGRSARVWHRHSSGLPRRLVRAGRDRFGTRFVGVRLAALAAPCTSLLVADPTGPPAPLVDTPWWFAAECRTGLDLVAAAAGEVA